MGNLRFVRRPHFRDPVRDLNLVSVESLCVPQDQRSSKVAANSYSARRSSSSGYLRCVEEIKSLSTHVAVQRRGMRLVVIAYEYVLRFMFIRVTIENRSALLAYGNLRPQFTSLSRPRATYPLSIFQNVSELTVRG